MWKYVGRSCIWGIQWPQKGLRLGFFWEKFTLFSFDNFRNVFCLMENFDSTISRPAT